MSAETIYEAERSIPMYEMKTRVGFSQVDEKLELPLSGIINQLQDCATFHSQDT